MSSNPYSGPATTEPAHQNLATSRSMRIKSVDPLAAGKLLGVLYALLGLVIGGIMALVSVVGAVAGGGGDAAVGGLVAGLGSLIVIPLLYGLGGFIGGIISAFLYNVVAGMIGGMILEVEV